jgi:hypothetical protein
MSPGANNLPVGQRGYSADSETFILEQDEIANGEAYIFRLKFQNNKVIVEAKERSHESVAIFEGRMQDQ